MPFYDLSRSGDSALLHDGVNVATRERGESTTLLAYIAEIDSRGLFVSAGYSSMFTYCLKAYKLSEDAANARIQVARVARKFPFLFDALQDGRLHLTGVRLLAPHLTSENAEDLVAAATDRSMTEIQRLIAQRFPLDEPPKATQTIRAIPSGKVGVPVSRRIDPLFQGLNESGDAPQAASIPPIANQGAGRPPDSPSVPADPSPAASCPVPSGHVAPERYLVRFTVGRGTHDKLRYAQMLSSHSNPGGSIERIVDEALDLFIERREKQKFAATSRPRPRVAASMQAKSAVGGRPGSQGGVSVAAPSSGRVAPTSARGRYIPAAVKRAVWKRDRGRCTFVSASGHRCESRMFLEFDHVEPVARGGTATVERIRLRCRAHNQYEAEQAFGPEFMRAKREEARSRGGDGRPEDTEATKDSPNASTNVEATPG
ncbi:MAG TPA: hypothetical protein VKF80_12000 [Candidatus Eisenbacteria bacterium]|nr:hypothetical protein [Candidatus Eisenbacteria bacterium]